YHTAAHLVADRDDREPGTAVGVDDLHESLVDSLLPARFLLPRTEFVQYPAQPGAETVDQQWRGRGTQGCREISALHGVPMGGTASFMVGDPSRPLRIVIAGRGATREVGHLVVLRDQSFRVV